MKKEHKITLAEIKEYLNDKKYNGIKLANLLDALPLDNTELVLALDSYWVAGDGHKLFAANEDGVQQLMLWYDLSPSELVNLFLAAKENIKPIDESKKGSYLLATEKKAAFKNTDTLELIQYDKDTIFTYLYDNAIAKCQYMKNQPALMNKDTTVLTSDEVKHILKLVCQETVTKQQFKTICNSLHGQDDAKYEYLLYRVCTLSENKQDVIILASFLYEQQALDYIRDRFINSVNSERFEILSVKTHAGYGTLEDDTDLTEEEVTLIVQESLEPIDYNTVRIETVNVDDYNEYVMEVQKRTGIKKENK